MGMFLKTVFTGIIAAVLAGSVVYFGTPENPSYNTSTNDRPKLRQSVSPPQQAANPNERWIDTQLRRLADKISPKQSERPLSPVAASVTPQPNEQPQAAPQATERVRYYRLENGDFKEVDSIPYLPSLGDAANPNVSARISAVMAQAEQIKQKELRDRAYLDIVDYSVSENIFSAAKIAMTEINQAELRDTARSRIAIAYAQLGDPASAFALIDAVEVDELRDVMRLQVIEALIVPPMPQNAQ